MKHLIGTSKSCCRAYIEAIGNGQFKLYIHSFNGAVTDCVINSIEEAEGVFMKFLENIEDELSMYVNAIYYKIDNDKIHCITELYDEDTGCYFYHDSLSNCMIDSIKPKLFNLYNVLWESI